jgi:hypothetical protein
LANIAGLIQKEFNRLRTDKRTLFLIFAIPAILIVIFGLTSGGGAQKYFTISILTEDELPMENFAINLTLVNNTAEFDDLFINTVRDNCTSFGLKSFMNITDSSQIDFSIDAARNLIKKGEIDAVVILEANFSESVFYQFNPTLLIYCDGSEPRLEETLMTALQEPIALFKLQTQVLENFTFAFHYFEYDVPK